MIFRFKVIKRQDASAGLQAVVIFLSVMTGLIFVGLIFLAKGLNPFYCLGKIFSCSFGSVYGLKETVTKAIPLIIIGSGLALCFKSKFWNIGAEGQLLFGAVFATGFGLKFAGHLPTAAAIPLIFLAGFAGGAVYGLIPALLKVKYNINEIISTLMLNYVAAEFVQYLVYGPWKGKAQWGFPYTDNLPESAVMPLIAGSRIHYPTLILALISAGLLYILMTKTKFGFESKVIGESPDAARYAGMSFYKNHIVVMLLAAGLAGIAGAGEVSGIHHHLTYPQVISGGYGFTAIIVACLAKNNPLLVIFSSLFFAGILIGGDAIQISLGLPFSTVNIFNGIILLCLIMGDFFIENKLGFAPKSPAPPLLKRDFSPPPLKKGDRGGFFKPE